MRVQLIASTQFHGVDGFIPDGTLAPDDAQHAIEVSGRSCYLAFRKPNPATATNQAYIANLLSSRHLSVVEHASASFYITGVSRNLTHELIRHRHFSFSEVSQRYVDAANLSIVRPPAFGNGDWLWLQRARDHALDTETRIVVSGNYRSWIEFLQKRDDPAADAEIRLLAQEVGRQLAVLAPHVFGPAARRLWSWDTSQEAPRNDS